MGILLRVLELVVVEVVGVGSGKIWINGDLFAVVGKTTNPVD